jgi:hypothetical protein
MILKLVQINYILSVNVRILYYYVYVWKHCYISNQHDRFKLRKLLLTESHGNVGSIGNIGCKPYVYVVCFSCQQLSKLLYKWYLARLDVNKTSISCTNDIRVYFFKAWYFGCDLICRKTVIWFPYLHEMKFSYCIFFS